MIVLSVVRELGSDAAGAPGLGSQKVAEELSGASLTQDQRTGFQNGSTWLVSWFPATWPPCGVTPVLSQRWDSKGTGVFPQECRKASQRRQPWRGISRGKKAFLPGGHDSFIG